LLPFVPQSTFLTLLATGDRYAVGSKGGWCFEAAMLWRLKDHIDRAFMRKYSSELPVMEEGGEVTGGRHHHRGGADTPSVATGAEALAAIAGARRMRCGGCGAKVRASPPDLTRPLPLR
jgi:selenide,water dikinase